MPSQKIAKLQKNWGNIGNVFRRIGEYDKAIQCHGKDLKIAKKLGD